jgi:hypothetical protein
MGSLNLINFENLIVDDNVLKILPFILSFIPLIEALKKVSIKLEKKEKGKVLIIKKYKVEILIISMLLSIVVPICNYLIIYFGVYIGNYVKSKYSIFLFIVIIEVIILVNIIFSAYAISIIYKYNNEKKYKFTFVSYSIIFQCLLLLIILIIEYLNININVVNISNLLIMIIFYTFLFYFAKLYFCILFSKLNCKYHADKIEIVINTGHYYKINNTERILFEKNIVTNSNKLVLLNDNGDSTRKIDKEWIEQINVITHGAITKSIDKNELQNSVVIFKKLTKSKIGFIKSNSKKN